MGLTFDRPGRRIAKLEEVVALIKAHCARRGAGLRRRVRQRARLRGSAPAGTAPSSTDHDRRRWPARARRWPAAKPTSSASPTCPSSRATTPASTQHAEAQRRDRATCVRRPAERFDELEIESSPYFTEITDDPEAALAESGGEDRDSGRNPARPSQRADRLAWTPSWMCSSRAAKNWASTTSPSSSRRRSLRPVVAALRGR